MGGGNKEILLIDSIRNGDSQTAIKLLQNSMIKNQSIKSKLNQKLNSHLASSNTSLAGSTAAQSNSRNRSLSVDCNNVLLVSNNTATIRHCKKMPESNRIQSTSNSNLTTKRKKHVNKLFDIKSLNTNNKLITKMFQYYDESNNNPYNTMKSKLNLNYQDDKGILHEACINGSLELVKLIVESGTKLNAIDSKGYTPLHYACLNGKIEIVGLLLQNDVDSNEPTQIGNDTPLHLTIQHSDTSIAEKIVLILLTNGAHLSLCISNKHNQLTPFELACENGQTQIVNLILKYCAHKSFNNKPLLQLIQQFSVKSLHLAAKNGHDNLIRLLLIYNVCDLNRCICLHDINGTSLHEASRYGRQQTVKLLLESGVDTRIKNSLDQTALDCVIKQKTGNEIKCLIQEYSQCLTGVAIKSNQSSQVGSLNFEPKEIINVLERNEQQSWRGFILNKMNFTSKYGYFPSSHVRIINNNNNNENNQENPYGTIKMSQSPASASSLSSSSSSTIPSPCSSTMNVTSLLKSGMNDSQIVFNWLKDCQLDQYYENFVKSGYDLLTIARGTTPSDLVAIGISNPLHRQILKQNMQRLNTKDLEDKLTLLLNDVTSIHELLKLIHLDQYLDAINELKLFKDINDFANTVNWEDLEEIGFKLGHSCKLMHVLKCYKNRGCKLIELTENSFENSFKLAKETAILNSPPIANTRPMPPKRVDSIKPLPPTRLSSISMSSYATLPRNRNINNTNSNSNKILQSPLSLKTTNTITEPNVLNDIDNMLFDLNQLLDAL